MAKKIKFSPAPNKEKVVNYDDLLEDFSPIKVGKIFPTNAEKPPATLESFRPKKYTCLDYNLSETYLRWQVGDTKIRASNIRGDYVLAPPGYFSDRPRYSKKYFSGRGPVWKFLDEIRQEKIEKKQAEYRARFAKFVKDKKAKKDAVKFGPMHRLITSLAGPDWFQELSPTQLRTVDKLQECILKDLKRKTIDNVKANISELGLFFRSKDQALQTALNYCCANDVEFLLILYQVSNPKRKTYSVNDRIILSAVVHLSIVETLRECHIRMPSPPRKTSNKCVCNPCKGIKQPNKKFCAISRPPKVEYESPYLIPFTFKPDPPKYSGKYEPANLQYPNSPYFCYLDELRKEISNTESVLKIDVSEISDPTLQDILTEMQEAEKLYNKLPHKKWTCLVQPTIKVRCMDFLNRGGTMGNIILPPLCELEETLPPCTCMDVESTDSECCTDLLKCECNKDPKYKCICKKHAKDFIKYSCKRCQILRRVSKTNIVGGIVEFEGEAIPVVQGTFLEKECDCMSRFKNQLQLVSTGNKMSCNQQKFAIGGVAYTEAGAVYIIDSQFAANQEIADQITKQKNETKKDICTCNLPKGGLSEKCFMDDFTKKEEEVEEVTEKQSNIVMPWETAKCKCKDGLKDFFDEQCTCPDCLENTRPQTATYVVSGVTSIINDDGEVENIVNISGVQQNRCDCLHKYLDKIKKLEEYRQRTKARLQMKTRENQYSIGGVTMGPDGPVYNIQGVTQPITCTCLEDHQKAEEEMKKRMPEMPNTGRIKYRICGVVATGDKNYYNIGHALPIKICDCENLFHDYEDEHLWCLESYQEYLKTTEDEIRYLLEEELYNQACEENEECEEEMGEMMEFENIYGTREEEDQRNPIPNYVACLCAPPKLGNQKFSPCQKNKIKECSLQKPEIKLECTCQKQLKSSTCKSSNNEPIDSGKTKELKSECTCQKQLKSSICKSSNNEPIDSCKTKEKVKTCSCQDSNVQNNSNSNRIFDQEQSPGGFEEIQDCTCQKQEETLQSPDGCNCLTYKDEEIRCDCYKNFDSGADDCEDLCYYDGGTDDEEVTKKGKSRNSQEFDFENANFKRFFILKKIPCKKSKQEEILKKLLDSLALDGYPLAKLPQCHKLPIFQLWMYLRCGKSWNRIEREHLNDKTTKYMKHTVQCYPRVKVPDIPLSSKLLNNLNWNHFKFIRALASGLEFNFRRRIKYERINSAREYFPLMFDYWFPFRTFRDCYFAYMPSKENDIYVGNYNKNQTRIIKHRDMSCYVYHTQ